MKGKYLKIEEVKREFIDLYKDTFVWFKIVAQSHRTYEFGGKIIDGKLYEGEEFVASNGLRLISRRMIQPKSQDGIFFVRGTERKFDDNVERTPLRFYNLIVEAVAEYNRVFCGEILDIPDSLFELE